MNLKVDQHQGTVLVVDDAPDTLRMLCDALAQEGYTVLVARDGREYQIADSAAPIRDSSGAVVGVVLVLSLIHI